MAASMASMATLMQNMRMPLPQTNMKPFTMPTPPKLTGALAPNQALARAFKYAANLVTGPESMVVYKRFVYTGLANGDIVEIKPSRYRKVRRILRLRNNKCQRTEADPNCVRPLGVRVNSKGNLVVADAYMGIFVVHPVSGAHKQLVDATLPKYNMRFVNDLAVTKSGFIFFTSSSAKYNRKQFMDIILSGDKSGKVMVYNPRARPDEQVKEIMSNLHFPNGLQLSKDESYLLIAEGARSRIFKAWIGPKSPKRGTFECFIDNLPGFVDNIRLSPRGTYWVALSSIRSRDKPGVLDQYGDQPQIREFILRMPREQMMAQAPKYGMILEVNENGQIIRSLHDPQGVRFTAVSEIEEQNGLLFLGSFNKKFVGILELNKLPPAITPPPGSGGCTDSGSGATTTTTPVPTTQPPTNAPPSNPVVNFLNNILTNSKTMSAEKLRDVVMRLVQRLLEAKLDAQRAVERANHLQQKLNAVTNNNNNIGTTGMTITTQFAMDGFPAGRETTPAN